MKRALHYFISTIVLTISVSSLSMDECEQWFEDSKIKVGPNCLTKCASLPTGMGTFACPAECKTLCSQDNSTLLGRILYYPGLTKSEQDLIRARPKGAIIVYRAKRKAEQMTRVRFGRDEENDESDAFRHFVWAAMLSKDLGSDTAKLFLDAHEASGNTQDASRAMDLANNRAGLLAAEKLKRNDKLSEMSIEQEALQALREKSLVVLSPKEKSK